MYRFCTQIMFLLAVTLVLLQQSALQAEVLHQAALVVQSGDVVLTRCVSFSSESITGAELLERSGLYVELTHDPGMGAFVCKIDRYGCPAENCMCAYPPDYWRYWLQRNGTWQFSPVGASNRLLRHGDMDGWTWGGTSIAPPLTFDAVCSGDTPLYRVYLPLIQNAPAATGQHFSLATLRQEPPSPQKRSGLMVQYGDGSIETACVTWEGGLALTAEELLARSGLEVQIGEHDYGGSAVCKIGKDGCALDAGENCYCAYDPNSDTSRLWLAYQLRDGVWHDPWPPYISRRNVYDGDVEAWVWGYPGGIDRRDATRPAQVLSFEQICAVPTLTPTLEPAATPTMTGTPTTTPGASVTSTATTTPPADTPTATMTATASVEPTAEARAARTSVIYLPLIMSMAMPDMMDDQSPASVAPPPATSNAPTPSPSPDRVTNQPIATPTTVLEPATVTSLPPTIPATSTPTVTPLPPTIPVTSTPTITLALPTLLPTLPPTEPPTSEPPSPTASPAIVIEATSLPVAPERQPTLEPLVLPATIVRPTSTSSISPTPTARGQMVAAADTPPVDGSTGEVLAAGIKRPQLATTPTPASQFMAILVISGLFVVLFISLIVVLYLKQRHPRLLVEQAIDGEGEERYND